MRVNPGQNISWAKMYFFAKHWTISNNLKAWTFSLIVYPPFSSIFHAWNISFFVVKMLQIRRMANLNTKANFMHMKQDMFSHAHFSLLELKRSANSSDNEIGHLGKIFKLAFWHTIKWMRLTNNWHFLMYKETQSLSDLPHFIWP